MGSRHNSEMGMNIYRHKQTKVLYTIEYLLIDIHFADCGARVGIYACPIYNGDTISHLRKNKNYNPDEFISQFKLAYEVWLKK